MDQNKNKPTSLNFNFHDDRLRSLGELSASILHEINQPVTSIRMCSELSIRKIKKNNLKDIYYLQTNLQEIINLTKKVEEIKPKEIDNFEEYLKEEEIQKRISDNADVVEQISYKVIKDIEGLWIRPNSAKIGKFADFNLRINRLGIIENIEMKQTSGDNAFDRAALNAIRKYKQIKYVRNLDDQTFQAYFSNFTLRFRPE